MESPRTMRQRLTDKLRSPKAKSKAKSKAKAAKAKAKAKAKKAKAKAKAKAAASGSSSASSSSLSSSSPDAPRPAGAPRRSSASASSSPSRRRSLPPAPPTLASLPLTPSPLSLPIMTPLAAALGLEHASAARAKRPSRATLGLPDSLDTLGVLAAAGAWGDVIDAARAIVEAAASPPHEIVAARTARVVAMVKLGMFGRADVEIGALLNHLPLSDRSAYPDHYGPDAQGSFLPFVAHFVGAQLHFHLGDAGRALEAHRELLAWVRAKADAAAAVAPGVVDDAVALDLVTLDVGIELLLAAALDNPDSADVWASRELAVLLSYTSIYLALGEHVAAIALFKDEVVAPRPTDPGLVSTLGRLYLRVGAVAAAAAVFARAEALAAPAAPSASAEDVPLVHVNRGYVAIAQGQHAAGALCFQRALDLYVAHEKANPDAVTWSEQAKAAAANNRAVCWLHAGHLDKAIKSLEAIINASPACNANPTLIANLCALYDLAGRSVTAAKTALVRLVAAHAPDNFDISVLRIGTSVLNPVA